MRRCRGSPTHALPDDEVVGRMGTQLGERHGPHRPIPSSPLTSRRPALARLLLHFSGMLPMGALSPGVHPDTEGDLM